MNQILVSDMPGKVLIMAGGTGGHIFPALSIARELTARGASVEWLGTRQGMEARLIGETDIPLHFINISGLRGKGLRKLLVAPFTIIRAVWQSVQAIRRIGPGCVLGMGGFVTGPGGLAARLLGKKLLIHEQNAIAGMSNQLLFPLAHVAMEGFAGAFVRKQQRSRLPLLGSSSKIRVVGNPVREDILHLSNSSRAERSGPLRILVIGGSLGAVAINKVIPELLNNWPAGSGLQVKHQCGVKNLEATQLLYQTAGKTGSQDIEVLPFIDDMAAAYEWADVVICRAGASTVAELQVAGLPAILVPYPWAVDDHQTANARTLVTAGGGWLIPQNELNAEALLGILAPLAADRSKLQEFASASLRQAVRDATGKAADLCLEACYA